MVDITIYVKLIRTWQASDKGLTVTLPNGECRSWPWKIIGCFRMDLVQEDTTGAIVVNEY